MTFFDIEYLRNGTR